MVAGITAGFGAPWTTPRDERLESEEKTSREDRTVTLTLADVARVRSARSEIGRRPTYSGPLSNRSWRGAHCLGLESVVQLRVGRLVSMSNHGAWPPNRNGDRAAAPRDGHTHGKQVRRVRPNHRVERQPASGRPRGRALWTSLAGGSAESRNRQSVECRNCLQNRSGSSLRRRRRRCTPTQTGCAMRSGQETGRPHREIPKCPRVGETQDHERPEEFVVSPNAWSLSEIPQRGDL